MSTSAAPPVPVSPPDGDRSDPAKGQVASSLAFLAAAALVAVPALRGGAYDVVVRHEHGIVAWWVIALGVAAGVLPRARAPRAALLPVAALAGLAVWTALSLAWTDSAERTLVEAARVLTHLGLLVLVLAVVGRETWRAAAAGVLAGAVLVCAVALAARLGALGDDVVARSLGTTRLSFPLDYWNAVGAWGAMTIVLALAWAAHARSVLARALALAALPLCGTVVYLTYSRAAVGATAAGLLALVVLARHRVLVLALVAVAAAATAAAVLQVRGAPAIADGTGTAGGAGVAATVVLGALVCAAAAWALAGGAVERAGAGVRARAVAAAVGTVAVLVCAGAVATGAAGAAWDDFRVADDVRVADDPSARLGSLGGARYGYWRTALRAFSAEPLQGVGAGTYELWRSRTATGNFARDAHSLELEHLAELGLPGGLLAAGVVGGLLAAALAGAAGGSRSGVDRPGPRAGPGGERRGVVAGLVAAVVAFTVSSAVDWMWEVTAVVGLAVVAAAVSAAPVAGPRPRLGRPARLAAAFVALAVAAALVPSLVATSRLRASGDALRDGRADAALREARRAGDAAPWAASPRLQEALAAEAAGGGDAARRAARDAVDREPTDWRHRLVLARLELAAGRTGPALAQFRRARRLFPSGSVFAPDPDAALREALERFNRPPPTP